MRTVKRKGRKYVLRCVLLVTANKRNTKCGREYGLTGRSTGWVGKQACHILCVYKHSSTIKHIGKQARKEEIKNRKFERRALKLTIQNCTSVELDRFAAQSPFSGRYVEVISGRETGRDSG